MLEDWPSGSHARATASGRRLLVLHDERVDVDDLLKHVFDDVRAGSPFPQARLQTRYFDTIIDCWIESFATGTELQLADAYTSPEAAEVLAALGAVLVLADSDSVLPLLARLQASVPGDVAAVACWPEAEEAILHGFEVVATADTGAIRMAVEVGPWTEQVFDEAPVELDHAASMLTALRGEASIRHTQPVR